MVDTTAAHLPEGIRLMKLGTPPTISETDSKVSHSKKMHPSQRRTNPQPIYAYDEPTPDNPSEV